MIKLFNQAKTSERDSIATGKTDEVLPISDLGDGGNRTRVLE